jgi:hypothetical protein
MPRLLLANHSMAEAIIFAPGAKAGLLKKIIIAGIADKN